MHFHSQHWMHFSGQTCKRLHKPLIFPFIKPTPLHQPYLAATVYIDAAKWHAAACSKALQAGHWIKITTKITREPRRPSHVARRTLAGQSASLNSLQTLYLHTWETYAQRVQEHIEYRPATSQNQSRYLKHRVLYHVSLLTGASLNCRILASCSCCSSRAICSISTTNRC